MTLSNTARALKMWREMAGLSQQEMADLSGLPYTTIEHYEIGRRVPDPETVERVSTALGMTAADREAAAGYIRDTVPRFRLTRLADDRPLAFGSPPTGGSTSPEAEAGTSEDPKSGSKEAPGAGVPPSEVFRETFLFVLDAGDAEAFRRIGEVVQERLLDRVIYHHQEGGPLSSFTLAEMFAVAVDLRFLEKYLYAVASERRLSELTPTEQALSAFAEELAPQVGALAEKLERRTDRLISDDQDETPQAEG